MRRIVLLSFADTRFGASLARIGKEAKESLFFDNVILKTENDFDSNYFKTYHRFYEENPRGYGYWLWKSYFVKQELEKLSDNDILVYADAGCEIHADGKKKFEQYIQEADNNKLGLVVFGTGLPEYQWTKGDVLDFLCVRENNSVLQSEQVMGGLWLMRKTENSVNLVNRWYDICHNHFELITDLPSKSSNIDGFIENRHDQSVFSILAKINGAVQNSAWEIQVVPSIPRKWSELRFNPFWAVRNKTAIEVLDGYPKLMLPFLYKYWHAFNSIENELKKIYHSLKNSK